MIKKMILSLICIYNSYSEGIVEKKSDVILSNDYFYVNCKGLTRKPETNEGKDYCYCFYYKDYEKYKHYLTEDDNNCYLYDRYLTPDSYYHLFNVKRYKIDLKNIEDFKLRLNDKGNDLFNKYFNNVTEKGENKEERFVTCFSKLNVNDELFDIQINHINATVIFKIKKECEKIFKQKYCKVNNINFITENLVPDDILQKKLENLKESYYRRANINDFKTALIDKLKKRRIYM